MRTKFFLIGLFTIISSTFLFSQNYFPLEIGNKWEFSVLDWDPTVPYSRTDTITIEVIKDTVMPNNIKYFVLNSYLILGDILRTDSLGIYYYDIFDSTDQLVYFFIAKVDEPYKTGFQSGGDSAQVTLYSNDSVLVLGRGVQSLGFSYSYLTGHNIVFAENIGPINIHVPADGFSSVTDYELIGYEVSGKSYGTLTNVEIETIGLKDYKLHQNYPNPFNPTTTISYSVPESQIVELKVYDLLGNEVANLVNEYKNAGNHSVQFNASNLSSGIYFYKLKTVNFVQTKKLILLK